MRRVDATDVSKIYIFLLPPEVVSNVPVSNVSHKQKENTDL